MSIPAYREMGVWHGAPLELYVLHPGRHGRGTCVLEQKTIECAVLNPGHILAKCRRPRTGLSFADCRGAVSGQLLAASNHQLFRNNVCLLIDQRLLVTPLLHEG